MLTRKTKHPPKRVCYWVDTWHNYIKSNYMMPSKKDTPSLIKLSGLITLVAPKKQSAVFWALSLLLIHKKNKFLTEQVVAALPTTKDGIRDLTKCIRYYEKLAEEGDFESLKKGKFNPVVVLEAITKIGPSYRVYLDHYRKSFYTYPAKIFSEELIKKAKNKLRGQFGSFGHQQSDFQKEIAEKVEEYDV